MKIFIIALSVILFLSIFSCKNLAGNYKNNTGYYNCDLHLNKDKTFLYKCYGHLYGQNWSYGYWEKKKDTLYFTREILHDTLRFPKDNFDTLVLSNDYKPKLKVYDDLSQSSRISYLGIYVGISLLNPQRRFFIFPEAKLIIRKNKLYELDDQNNKISKDYFVKKRL